MLSTAMMRQRMNETGIGYAGIDGVWWRPATAPCALPAMLRSELAQIGRSLFALFDAVLALHDARPEAEQGLQRLLKERVSPELASLVANGRVELVRPDFQLVPIDGEAGYRLVATELEICPSAQGFAHAMQVGYGLATDLANQVAHWLQGRPLLIVATAQWSEFLFDQLAFCRALAERGAQAQLLFDRPLAAIAAEVRRGERWQPPLFGVDRRPQGWDEAVLARIRRHALEPYLWPDDHEWPAAVGEAVLFRFGYLDTFSPAHLARLQHWSAHGATLLNPVSYFLDSKTLLATLNLPAVRRQIARCDQTALALLDRTIPETILLERHQLPRLRREQAQWVIKFAGFDRGNEAWGGRSLRLGAGCSAAQWDGLLRQSLRLDWPVVAQRAVPSAQVQIDYFDEADQPATLCGTTRLRSFLLRPPAKAADAWVGGTHLTVTAGSAKVAESTVAVQAPIEFVGCCAAPTG
jgi:hypothetical protein